MFIVKFLGLFFKILSLINSKWAGRLSVELLFRPFPTKRNSEENLFWARGVPVSFESGCKGRIFNPTVGTLKGTVALVHGWQSQGVKFQKIIELLLQHQYQVVVWNGPAHGESPGHRTHLAEFTRILVNDLKKLGLNYHIVIGYSFGAAAAAYATQLGLESKHLVLISGPSSARRVFERYWKLIKLGTRAQHVFIQNVEKEALVKTDDLSSENFIHQIKQNILLIHDENDKLVPFDDALRLKNLRTDIDLFSTQKLGHFKILKSEIVLSKLNEFFGEVTENKKHVVSL